MNTFTLYLCRVPLPCFDSSICLNIGNFICFCFNFDLKTHLDRVSCFQSFRCFSIFLSLLNVFSCLSLCVLLYIHMYMYLCTIINMILIMIIPIKNKNNNTNLSLNLFLALSLSLYKYIYIYIYMTNLTVHLEAPGGPAGQNCPMTSHTPTPRNG